MIDPFSKSVVAEGDTVIVVLGADDLIQVPINKNSITQLKFGALKHNDVIGVKYGSKVRCSRGYVHILCLTAELWTQTLPHRTQILYTPDVSLIITQLDLSPGSVVMEAGTGSGSLSHALARTILPCGRLFTFDFHEARVETARREFLSHGLDSVVECSQRDVIKDGFPQANIADAVMLDLPQPWKVIPAVQRVLKSTGGRLCLFSPCIEQVQRSCEALREAGFCQLETLECLQSCYDMVKSDLPVANIGQQLSSYLMSYVDNEKTSAANKPNNTSLITKEVGTNNVDVIEASKEAVPTPLRQVPCCRPVQTVEKGDELPRTGCTCSRAQLPATVAGSLGNEWHSLPPTKMAGHTGFLTFCSWVPPPLTQE